MAYVNISSDGAKPVGPIGLKRAEKELIMRRYKYNHHHPNDNINRVALIYGQQHPQYNSHDRQYLNDLQGIGNRVVGGPVAGYYNPTNNHSPYLVSVGSDGAGGRHGANNAVNIVRRSKNYLDELKHNSNSGYQVRLPKISNMNKNNHDYYIN